MPGEKQSSGGFTLRRWSQRKLAAAREERKIARDADAASRDPAAPEANAPASGEGVPILPSGAVERQAKAGAETGRGSAPQDVTAALPPIESLTIESDFAPFMRPGVDEHVRRSALRKLLRDPRFNVMDGLDVYIGDYSTPDPIEPASARALAQARYVFDPPKTRVNADGHVEDVVDEVDASADATPPPGVADAGRSADTEPMAKDTKANEHRS